MCGLVTIRNFGIQFNCGECLGNVNCRGYGLGMQFLPTEIAGNNNGVVTCLYHTSELLSFIPNKSNRRLSRINELQ